MSQLTNRELQDAIAFWQKELRDCYTSIPRSLFEPILDHWRALMTEQRRRIEPLKPCVRVEINSELEGLL